MASWINFGRETLWITLLGASQEFENLLEFFFLLRTCNVKAKKVMIYQWLNTQEVTKTYWNIKQMYFIS